MAILDRVKPYWLETVEEETQGGQGGAIRVRLYEIGNPQGQVWLVESYDVIGGTFDGIHGTDKTDLATFKRASWTLDDLLSVRYVVTEKYDKPMSYRAALDLERRRIDYMNKQK